MRLSNLPTAVKVSVLGLAVIAPVMSQDSTKVFTIIDFESRQIQSTLSVYGGAFADNSELAPDTVTYGNSMLTTFSGHEDPDSSLWVQGYREESSSALQMGYQLGTVRLGCGEDCTYAPHVGIAIGFSPEYDPIELTGATHITFWAKGRDSLTMSVSIGMRDSVTSPADYSQSFTIDTTWKKYSIKLEPSVDFKLPTWVPQIPFDVVRVNSISFGINKDENPNHLDNALFLDDVEIVNWELSYVSGIFKHGRNAGQVHGLRARLSGDVAYVRLPSSLFGKSGVIEAMDATGRKIGQTAFGPQAQDVSLTVPGASAKSAGLFFRAIPK